MGIKIDWSEILQPLITTLLTAIIKAIIKAIQGGDWAKGMAAISQIEAVAMDNPLSAAQQLGKIAEGLNA